jgi:hypothetical protein
MCSQSGLVWFMPKNPTESDFLVYEKIDPNQIKNWFKPNLFS